MARPTKRPWSSKLKVIFSALTAMAIGSCMDHFILITWRGDPFDHNKPPHHRLYQQQPIMESVSGLNAEPNSKPDDDAQMIEIPEIFRWSESTDPTDQYLQDDYVEELEEEIDAIRIRWRHLDDASIDSILITLFIENYSENLSLDAVGQLVMMEVKKVLYRIDSLYLLPRFEKRAQRITREILERSQSPQNE